jgi:hypothetical protein
VERPVGLGHGHAGAAAVRVVTLAAHPAPHQVGRPRVRPLQLLEAPGERVVAVGFGRSGLVPMPVVDQLAFIHEWLVPPLPLVVDDHVAGDPVDPGAEVAATEPGRQGLPRLCPHVLMDVVEHRHTHPPAEEREQALRVPVVQGAKGGVAQLPGVRGVAPAGARVGQFVVRGFDRV